MGQGWARGTPRLLLMGALVLHFVLGAFVPPLSSCSRCVQASHHPGDCAAHHPGAACPLRKTGQMKAASLSCAIVCPHHHSAPSVSPAGQPFLLAAQPVLPSLTTSPFPLLFSCFTCPDGYSFPLLRPPPLSRALNPDLSVLS